MQKLRTLKMKLGDVSTVLIRSAIWSSPAQQFFKVLSHKGARAWGELLRLLIVVVCFGLLLIFVA